MDKDFHVFDFHRIFIGDLPISFMLEIVFRTLIMYSYTIVLLRILGKRGMGQLSTLELAIIISFGSAVGDPMVGANVPILHGMLSISVVAIFQIWVERLINKNKKVEAFMEGQPGLMVENGVIQWECMVNENLSREDLFRFLRGKEVDHLGQIHKALFEISGQVSVMFQPPKKVRPGLSVLPENNIPLDAVLNNEVPIPKAGYYSCMNCGNTKEFNQQNKFPTCEVCKTEEWIKSVEEK
jgi:uncharacterized membrane protein YcaP (DUF421 family)